jgi:F-type H+-transporting ATPase subunit a
MKRTILLLTLLVAVLLPASLSLTAGEAEVSVDAPEVAAPVESEEAAAPEEKAIDPKEIIFEHLGDGYGWEVPFCHDVRIPLPVIVRDWQGGWHCFSSARVSHGKSYITTDAEGNETAFCLGGHDSEWSNKLIGLRPEVVDGETVMVEYRPLDLSITKNVAAIFIACGLVMWMVLGLASWYRKEGYKAPRRVRGFVELIIEFVYYGVVKPSLGEKSRKFGPYLLTVFFFILVANLLGLIVIFPGGANITGNIAVTLVLSLCTFFAVNFFGTKHYWKEVFWPEVPLWLKFPLPIMPIIEVFGVFTKPAALTVRLFANMMGGHMIVIVLTLLIFILGAMGTAVLGGTLVVSLLFSVFMLLIDVLVSFIQAYVFTMLSTIFIVLAQESGEHPKKEAKAIEG